MPWGLIIFVVVLILLVVGGFFLYRYIKGQVDDIIPDTDILDPFDKDGFLDEEDGPS